MVVIRNVKECSAAIWRPHNHNPLIRSDFVCTASKIWSSNEELRAPDLNSRRDLCSDSIYGKVRLVLACFGQSEEHQYFVAEV